MGNEKAEVWQIGALVLAALDGFHVQRAKINLGRTGKLPRLRRARPGSAALLLVLMLGIEHLNLLRRDVLGDGQVAGKRGVAVLLVNRLVRPQRARRHEQPLEPLALTELAESLGMAMVEVLVTNEDVIVDRLRVVQVFAKEIRIERDVHVAKPHVKRPTPPPTQPNAIHVNPYTRLYSRLRVLSRSASNAP